MRRRFISMSLASVALGVALVTGTGNAQAEDNGKNDGPQCSYTEICFRQTAGSDAMVKQFWYSANHSRVEGVHDYYRWYETATGTRGPYILDSARSLRNRDSSCTVFIWDMDGSGNWLKLWHQPANSSSWMALPPQNNGHSRCNEGAPVNK